MGIATQGAQNGFDSLDDDQRRRFWEIQIETDRLYSETQQEKCGEGEKKLQQREEVHEGTPVVSGDDKAPKELTDRQRVDVQVGQVDAVSGVSNVMHDAFGFKDAVRLLTYGKVTDFEDHQLNAMIDLVHQANPADLEHAGETLAKASKAINEAAVELRRHPRRVRVRTGRARPARRSRSGESLATHTEKPGHVRRRRRGAGHGRRDRGSHPCAALAAAGTPAPPSTRRSRGSCRCSSS